MLTEIFKIIKDYPNYEISNYGNVKNISTGKTLKHRTQTRGYKTVRLYNDNGSKNFLIHRLIGIHFIDNPNNYEIIDHIDRNTSNNNINNLRWVNLQTNNYNSDKHKGIHTSKYKGVYYSKKYNHYTSSIVVNGDKIHLGSFKNEEEAYEKRCDYIKNNNILV